MEGIEVSEMAADTRIDAVSSAMPMGASWGSYPRGRYWVPGSSEFSCQASQGRDMIED